MKSRWRSNVIQLSRTYEKTGITNNIPGLPRTTLSGYLTKTREVSALKMSQPFKPA